MSIIKPPDLIELEAQILALEDDLKNKRKNQRLLQSNIKVQCVHCDRLTLVKTLTYWVREHHYPWALAGEQDWFYHPEFVCPYCNKKNDLSKRPEVVNLKHAFKDEKRYPG